MTRDDARAAFTEAGLDYSDLSLERLRKLVSTIDAEMKSAGLIKGTYRMRRSHKIVHAPNGRWAALHCKSYYFDSREAVTFNPNGFIGFAGWADDHNIVPILNGFKTWVKWLANEKAAEATVEIASRP